MDRRRSKLEYSLQFGKWSRLGQRHGLQSTTLTSYFYIKNLLKTNICILLWKYFARQIYLCSFHISKLNDLKVIHDLYSQCLTQIMSKTTSFTKPEGVWDMTWSHVTRWRRSRQDLAWRTGCKCEGKSEAKHWTVWRDAWVMTWFRWTDATTKSKWTQDQWTNTSHDDMKWIISFVMMLVHVLHQHWRRWNGMRNAKV
jgi:hypothetical protein